MSILELFNAKFLECCQSELRFSVEKVSKKHFLLIILGLKCEILVNYINFDILPTFCPSIQTNIRQK